MFALVFWPAYVPFAFTMSEQMQFRRALCIAAGMGGLLVSAYNIFQLVGNTALPTVLGQSIHYGFEENYPARLTYGIVTMMPLFISNLRKMWILGALALLGFVVSDYLYNTVFISVWCFFAATISVLLYFILKDNERTAVS